MGVHHILIFLNSISLSVAVTATRLQLHCCLLFIVVVLPYYDCTNRDDIINPSTAVQEILPEILPESRSMYGAYRYTGLRFCLERVHESGCVVPSSTTHRNEKKFKFTVRDFGIRDFLISTTKEKHRVVFQHVCMRPQIHTPVFVT